MRHENSNPATAKRPTRPPQFPRLRNHWQRSGHEHTSTKERIIDAEIPQDIHDSPDLLLSTRAREHALKYMCPSQRHKTRVVHPAVLPKLGVEPRGLPVDYGGDRRPVDEDILREKIAVREVDRNAGPIRKTAEHFVHKLGTAEVTEDVAVVFEVLGDARERARGLSWVGHEVVVVGPA